MKRKSISAFDYLHKILTAIFLTVALSVTMVSCGPKDADIKAAMDQKIQITPEMTGVVAAVDKGVVTLSGECKDEACKVFTENTVKGMNGVKSVVNNTTVAPPPPPPVVIAADDPLTQGVTDATKDYPGVNATVADGVITLTGDIKRDDLKKLMMSLHTLNPKKIDNQLVIK